MIRNLAVTLVVLILIAIFQSHIKAGLFEARNAFALSRIDVEETKKSELRSAISRIADGYQRNVFTDTERRTLMEQLRILRSHRGQELDTESADGILRRLETVLERYKL